MKRWRLLLRVVLFLALITVASGPGSLQASEPRQAPDLAEYQLLKNPGMEVYDPPYSQYDGVNCQVATGWERFWYGSPEPYWMDTRVFAYSHLGGDWVERIEGTTSQLLFSTEPYTAGIQQEVSGLTPGAGYGFHAAMLTIFQTSAPPAVDNTMFKQVGMDPTGGTDPQAPTVVWDEADGHDEGPWSINLRTAVYAEVPTMTVFIRVISPFDAGPAPYLNLSFLDSAILAETPVVTAISPPHTEVPTFTVRWDNAVAAPGGYVRWYDVQWLDEVEGEWHDWYAQTSVLQSTFVAEPGHAYRFRARAWQRYDNGAHLYGPYRPEGDTRTSYQVPKLAGQVLNNRNVPVAGTSIAISGTTYTVTSGPGGQYEMQVLAWPDPQTVTVSDPNWAAPPPVHGVTFEPTETVTLIWTLRPPGDVVQNGDFEAGLDGWSLIAGQGVTPTVVTEPVHSGFGSLALGGAGPLGLTTGVTQTVVLTNAWEPALSFWVRPVTTDTDDVLNVILTVVTQTISSTVPVTPTLRGATAPLKAPITGPITSTLVVTREQVFTPSLEDESWQHYWYDAGPPDAALTGTVTIRFQVRDDGDGWVPVVYLDEVRLGASAGGPHKMYLPLVLRGP